MVTQNKTQNEIQKTESPLLAAAALVQADGNMDVAKLKELLDLQERWDATQAKKAFVRAMAEFKANPPEILKDRHVKYTTSKGITEYDHATLNNVTTIINKVLSNHGLTASWITEQVDKEIKVTCKVTHVDGHSEETSLTAAPDASGGKNSIQAIGSTVTYLRRYTLEAITGIASKDIGDDDGKGATPKDALPPKPNKQEQKVLDLIYGLLEKQTDKTILKDRVAAIFLTEAGKYPSKNPDKAVLWLAGLGKENEWTEPKTVKAGDTFGNIDKTQKDPKDTEDDIPF